MSGLVRAARKDGVLHISLDRPESRNALSSALVEELTAAFRTHAGDGSVRAVVLAGEGKDFCAGADIGEMQGLGRASRAENRADAERLAEAFRAVRAFPRPVVARVQGNVFGGGVGLVSAVDIAVCARDARFAFSEVRLGILPAIISPWVVRRIGDGAARRLFLTGERFDGEQAVALGLCGRCVDAGELDAAVEDVLADLLRGSPDAQRRIKRLLETLAPEAAGSESPPDFIAEARASEEGQEGLRAFLEKRPPSWVRERPSS